MRLAVGFVVTALLLWWALHDASWSDIVDAVRDARPAHLLLGGIAAVAAVALRGARWYLLFSPGSRPPLTKVVRATYIGAAANNLLPARAGELVAPLALRRLAGVPLTASVATTATARLLDVAVVAGLGLLGLASAPLPSGYEMALWWVVGIGLALPIAGAVVGNLVGRNAAFTGGAWRRRVVRGLSELGHLVSGLSGASALLTTVAAWLTSAFAFLAGFWAFGISVPPTAALTVQAFVAVAILLPAAPGFFGPFEAAARIGLGAYGISSAVVAAYVVPFHVAVFFTPVVAAGLVALRGSGVSLRPTTESLSSSSVIADERG